MYKKLNLGSGEFKKESYVNVDFFSVSEPDIKHNLNEFPYPFKDNIFELVEADHLLEHLENPFMVMKEIHRICINGARVIIRVPHFSRGFTHAEHNRGFDVSFPFYFNPSFRGGYQGVEFKIVKMKLTWFAQIYLKKTVLPEWMVIIASMVSKILDFFANLSPFICSRLWCFWFGGFEEIEYQFEVIKK